MFTFFPIIQVPALKWQTFVLCCLASDGESATKMLKGTKKIICMGHKGGPHVHHQTFIT